MGKILAIILALIIVCGIGSLPFYLLGNFLLWLFHSSFRLTLLQAFGLTLSGIILREFFFKNNKD